MGKTITLTIASLLATATSLRAATFTVSKTADTDDGQCNADCSLREALKAANLGAGGDTIQFAIPGNTDAGCSGLNGVCVIKPTSALPSITKPVTIDGYSQSGSSANTNGPGLADNAVLRVTLNGALAGSAAGLVLAAGSSGSTIKGLVVNGFVAGFHGIKISSSNNTIEGCFMCLTQPNQQ